MCFSRAFNVCGEVLSGYGYDRLQHGWCVMMTSRFGILSRVDFPSCLFVLLRGSRLGTHLTSALRFQLGLSLLLLNSFPSKRFC